MFFHPMSRHPQGACATSIARSVGMFVKRDTTLKDTSNSSPVRVWVVINSANSLEFRTADGDWQTRGDNMSERCLRADMWGSAQRIRLDAWGRSAYALWVGCTGFLPAKLRSISYSLSEMLPFLFIDNSRAFILHSSAGAGSLSFL